jgi:hypothetical protein
MKTCNLCKRDKPLDSFYASKNPSHKDGRQYYCKVCAKAKSAAWVAANPERVRANAAARKAKNPDGHRNGHLRRMYGITQLDYERMLSTQEGRCACCGSTEPGRYGHFLVDHDHDTGDIRGLLCHPCNAGIGLLGDTLADVRLAVAYLERAEISSAAAKIVP